MSNYGTRFGCRFGQPHDFAQIADKPNVKVEKCKICGARRRWNKGYKGRINSPAYLKDHVRNYAQKGGATRRVFAKLYEPETTVIIL